MANFCSGVKVRLFGGAAGSMSSSVTSSFWARSIKGVELVKVMVSVLPVSPWREERLRQVSHVSLTDRESSTQKVRWLRTTSVHHGILPRLGRKCRALSVGVVDDRPTQPVVGHLQCHR